MIREQALKIYKKLYDTEDVADEDLEFKASSSWFYLFLIKNKIKCNKPTGADKLPINADEI